ncbi:hypothetical protein RB195_012173 [Necator americanus]|uniref:Uncharacterized protein n=1 Tax=Necator americanus TaxID=51031 RepID=A0ABR1D5V9_NECAM
MNGVVLRGIRSLRLRLPPLHNRCADDVDGVRSCAITSWSIAAEQDMIADKLIETNGIDVTGIYVQIQGRIRICSLTKANSD